MEFVSDLNEVSFSSTFKWRINNLSASQWQQAKAKKNFIIKSHEIKFKQANAVWYVKIRVFVYNTNQKFLQVNFYVVDDGQDENARYKFNMKLSDGSVIDASALIVKNSTNSSALLDCELGKYITLTKDEDSVVLEPTCIMETLKHNKEVEEVEHELEDVEDVSEEEESDVEEADEQEKVEEAEPLDIFAPRESDQEPIIVKMSDNCLSPLPLGSESSDDSYSSSISKLSDDSDESDDEEDDDDDDHACTGECVDVMQSESEMRRKLNLDLSTRIKKIYLVKMEQIAATSASLLLTSARVSLSRNFSRRTVY